MHRTAQSIAAALLAVPCPLVPWPDSSASAQSPVITERGRTAPADPVQSWRSGRDAGMLALLDEHYEWLLRDDPLSASTRGDDRYNNLLRDESPAAYTRRLDDLQARLARLERLSTETWTDADRTDADLLRYELTRALEDAALFREQMPVSQMSGPQVWLPQMGDRVPMTRPAHAGDYAARLEAIPTYVDQVIEQMRAGLAAGGDGKQGRVPPRVTVLGTDAVALKTAEDCITSPRSTPFFKPLAGRPADDPAAARAERALREEVGPAMRRLGEFLRDRYLPSCRESTAIRDSIDGAKAYDLALREHTTTDLTAEQIHEVGMSEVARLRAEMLGVIARTDYPRKYELSGDALFAEFVTYLRSEPRFVHASAEDLLAGYRDICKRMDAEMPRLFGVLPRLPYGVREMPPFSAPYSPTAFYYPGSVKSGVAGMFIANTYRLDQRPKYEMVALALHEAVPGHHLQIALAQELEEVHPFRTMLGYTAFVEGWALYSERLGLEVGDDPALGGLYADPYDDFGRLTYEMWRACRLVVDTGLHALGWSRQRAIEYMLANTALSPHNIEREVDRYIAWPGQACAYKIGELRITAMRRKAEAALGAAFDLRAFHDELLGAGPLPMPALEGRMDRWIERQRARTLP